MTLWTPSGEHPVDRPRPAPGPDGAPPGSSDGPGSPPPSRAHGHSGEPADVPDPAQVEELRRQLAAAPAEVVVANHCYGLFELAAVYLSQSPPLLPQAQLAIDSLGYLVEGLGPRLGESRRSLQEALAQIRLAFVQMDAAERARPAGGAAQASDGAAQGSDGAVG